MLAFDIVTTLQSLWLYNSWYNLPYNSFTFHQYNFVHLSCYSQSPTFFWDQLGHLFSNFFIPPPKHTMTNGMTSLFFQYCSVLLPVKWFCTILRSLQVVLPSLPILPQTPNICKYSWPARTVQPDNQCTVYLFNEHNLQFSDSTSTPLNAFLTLIPTICSCTSIIAAVFLEPKLHSKHWLHLSSCPR